MKKNFMRPWGKKRMCNLVGGIKKHTTPNYTKYTPLLLLVPFSQPKVKYEKN
jgi:hypothetical protein